MKYNKIINIGNQKYKVYMTWDNKEIEKGLIGYQYLKVQGFK